MAAWSMSGGLAAMTTKRRRPPNAEGSRCGEQRPFERAKSDGVEPSGWATQPGRVRVHGPLSRTFTSSFERVHGQEP